MIRITGGTVMSFLCLFLFFTETAKGTDVLLDAMEEELARTTTFLDESSDIPLYYIRYSVTEESRYSITAVNGGFNAPESTARRYLDVDVRVGDPSLDNTHEIRGGSWTDNSSPRRIVEFPIENDPASIRAILWAETEYQHHKALERYTKVITNRQVKVEEEDPSGDFTANEPHRFIVDTQPTIMDTAAIRSTLGKASEYFFNVPFVLNARAAYSSVDRATYTVSTDGDRLQHGNHYLRIGLSISGMAEDGMELTRYENFSAADPVHLPDEEMVLSAAGRLVEELRLLMEAPVVEPYLGPAILRNRASAVFFHEIFGHRIEGHRQKRTDEGQTFTKKVGEEILPAIISVYDDPSMQRYAGKDLRGYYRFDDEGVPGQRVTVVENGILKSFLMSRSPIEGFPVSNGHGRRQHGYDIVARQGNLLIESSMTMPFDHLREKLVAECRRQDKPYGLVFEDISGGFTMTGRRGPQAFKVIPLLVTRVYTDGRPDEIVRGVDIVGTPLTSFNKIIATGDDYDVFNGTCGAESGMIPVSCISPSVLVSEIEVEKRRKGQEKPPILLPPRPASEEEDQP